MDEVFGSENFMVVICYRRLGMMVGQEMKSSAHYLVWYAKDKARVRTNKLFERQLPGIGTGDHYTSLEHAVTKEVRPLSKEERANPTIIPPEWKPFQLISLSTGGYRPNTTIFYEFEGKTYHPGANKCWRTTREGLDRLAAQGRIVKAGNTIRYKQYLEDFPLTELTTIWDDTARDPENFYVVQTPTNVIKRCVLMTTEPGDLVFDPTCGSGTTAYVAEYFGRRWVTADTSRVPLALARQRLLSATFPYYRLMDEGAGPSSGFKYTRRRSRYGEEIGGIVPHATLGSIAHGEDPKEERLVDNPDVVDGVLRVAGPFAMEATIAPSVGLDEEPETPGIQAEGHRNFVDRMIEVLRRVGVLRLPNNETLTLRQVRPPARTLALSAEALVDFGDVGERPVAIVFGPEDGPISERLVREAWREADLKGYARLFVIGFGIDPKARQFVEEAQVLGSVPCVYLQATMDLTMGDLLKNMRSSQVFSLCGLPDIELRPVGEKPSKKKGEPTQWQVELKKLNTFDPATMEAVHYEPQNIPAWFLDTDYNGMVFRVRQAFFPGTGSWDKLKKELRTYFEDSVWEHLAGTVSEPFEAGDNRQIAVKVIDPRGNELVVVKKLEAR